MTIKVTHPNGYVGVLYGRSSMAIYDKRGHEVMHTGFRNINTDIELYAVLDQVPGIKKLAKVVLAEGRQDEQN